MCRHRRVDASLNPRLQDSLGHSEAGKPSKTSAPWRAAAQVQALANVPFMVNAEHTERENIDRYNDNNHAILRLTDLAIRAVKDQCRLDVVRHEPQAVFPLAPSRATSPG
jgi:hypothetical protein